LVISRIEVSSASLTFMNMKASSAIILFVFASTFAPPCFAHHMAVVVSKENRVTAMSATQLGKIFRGETKKWSDGKYIAIVLHRSSSGEEITLERLNKMSSHQWQAWVNEHKDSLKIVDSDDEVLSYIENTPGAVGLIDVRSVNDRVNIVRIDGKVPMEAGYLPH